MVMQFSGINIYAKDALKSYAFYKGLGLTPTAIKFYF